jgi:peptidoglycan/xylan/chitin deacetylase (PgdA/CDA1 family)
VLKKIFKLFIFKFLPEKIFWLRGRADERVLHLTFDDGPTPGITDVLRDLLAEYDAKATFFVIGTKLEVSKNLATSLIDDGHIIANHSFDHIGFRKLGLSGQLDQVKGAESIIDTLPAKSYKYFRAPQGDWSIKLIAKLYFLGFRSVHWSYDSLDYSKLTPANIIENYAECPVKNGEILLFHDDSDKCIEVLKEMLPLWQRQGFKFKALS